MTANDFDTFVREKSTRLYRYAFFLIREKEDARDILQDMFTDLWKMGERTNSFRNMEALALSIVRNKCIDKMRSSYRKTDLERDLRHQTNAHAVDTPENILEADDTQTIIDTIVRALPPEQREILFLKNVEELTCEEIAAILDIKTNTVEVNLSRIRKSIRAKYNSVQQYKSK